MITIKSILCPLDFSDASKTAFRYACAFARSMGSKIHMLTVIEHRPLVADMMLTYIPVEEDRQREAHEELEPLLQEALREGIDVQVDILVGTPVDVILKQINDLDASIVIMGSHGRSGLGRVMMGSVAEGVIRKANVPVLIVKAAATGV